MRFIVAQVYMAFKRSENYNPDLSTRLYLLVTTWSAIVGLSMVVSEFLERMIFKQNYNRVWLAFFAGLVLYILARRYQKKYSKKRLELLVKESNYRYYRPLWVKMIMIVLFMISTFIGPIVIAFLFGGLAFGTKVNGVF